MRLWCGSRDRLWLPDRKASSKMGPPQAPGPTLKRQGQRLEAVNKEAHEGAGPELWVHRDLRKPRLESFISACRPTLATYIGAENLTNTKIGNASETNQS